MKLKFCIAGILLLLTSLAYAAHVSPPVKVTQIKPVVEGVVYFEVNSTAICGATTFKLVVNNVGSNATYSTLLAAASAGKNVVLETWGECAPNGGANTIIQAVTIKL